MKKIKKRKINSTENEKRRRIHTSGVVCNAILNYITHDIE